MRPFANAIANAVLTIRRTCANVAFVAKVRFHDSLDGGLSRVVARLLGTPGTEASSPARRSWHEPALAMACCPLGSMRQRQRDFRLSRSTY